MLSFTDANHISKKPSVLVPYLQGFNLGASDETQVDEMRFRIDRGDKDITRVVILDGDDYYWIDVVELRSIVRCFASLDTTNLRDLKIDYVKTLTDVEVDESGKVYLHDDYVAYIKFKLK